MTYCVGIMLDAGLVLASDSRTHAGVDNFASFCKMSVFERAGERVFVLLSSGNLAGTQAVIGLLKQRSAREGVPNLWSAESMFDAALLVSDAMRDVDRRDGKHLAGGGGSFNASFILGGQISGTEDLYKIYAESFQGSEHLQRILVEAQATVDAALALPPTPATPSPKPSPSPSGMRP